MSEDPIVFLALLMGLATFPTRLAPFVLPVDRIPDSLARTVRLMGPASLAAVAAVTVSGSAGVAGPGGDLITTWSAAAVCLGIVAVRRNLAFGLVGAIAIASLLTFSVL